MENEKVEQTTNYIAIGEMPYYDASGKCKGCGACTYVCAAGKDVRGLVAWARKESL